MAPANSSSSLGMTDYQAVLNLTTSSVPEFSGKSFGFILSGVACANQGSPFTLEVGSNHMASDKGTSSSSENREEREKGSKEITRGSLPNILRYSIQKQEIVWASG